MNINATILVQAFNFCIVYWMLRIFLFKPTIAIIEHEKAQENAMIAIIEQQKKSLEIQEKERQRHWYTCQEYFITQRPYAFQRNPCFAADKNYDAEIISTLSPDDIADTIAHLRTVLEERIKHVH